MRRLALACALALFGCDDPNVHAAAQTAAYQFMPDGSDPAVQDKVSSVLTDGIVDAEIECQGIALGGPGKAVVLHYAAQRLQDGACLATATFAAAGTPSYGAALTRRSDQRAATCPVPSFHGPMLRSDTTVSGGVIRVESPFCAPGACQMLVATNCTGLNTERF